jgi:hypothetical protein
MANQDEKNLTKGWIPTAFTFWQLVAVVLCLLLIFSIMWGRYGRVARPKTVPLKFTEANAKGLKNIINSGRLQDVLRAFRRE